MQFIYLRFLLQFFTPGSLAGFSVLPSVFSSSFFFFLASSLQGVHRPAFIHIYALCGRQLVAPATSSPCLRPHSPVPNPDYSVLGSPPTSLLLCAMHLSKLNWRQDCSLTRWLWATVPCESVCECACVCECGIFSQRLGKSRCNVAQTKWKPKKRNYACPFTDASSGVYKTQCILGIYLVYN